MTIHNYTWLYTAIHSHTYLYTAIHGYTQLYIAVQVSVFVMGLLVFLLGVFVFATTATGKQTFCSQWRGRTRGRYLFLNTANVN